MIEDYGALYRAMHKGHKAFRGRSIKDSVDRIAELVAAFKPRRILDYGCGKGLQYSEDKVHEKWGGIEPHCFDVGVPAFSEKPDGRFDAVICTDVMEHIAEADVEAVLADVFQFLPPRDDGGMSFAYFYISCRPAARKTLPDGRNVHLCVKPPEWWNERLAAFERQKLTIDARYEWDAA